MKLVTDLLPLNLLEEKKKFFVDPTKNPQLEYSRSFDEPELLKFGTPNDQLLALAHNILDQAYFHKTEADLFELEGRLLSQDEVTERTFKRLKEYNLSDTISIKWSKSYVVRTAMSPAQIKFRLPCDFREEGLRGMLAHEIETHALRSVNYQRQPWFRQKKKFGFQSYLATEEGLAVLHGQIPHTNKLLFIDALRYLAVWHAQKGSFLDVWHALEPYVDNLERRWMICSRVKRGLTDTSHPGGFTKDLLYLAGPVEMYNWLKTREFNLTPLYIGKLASSDVDKALKLNPGYQPLLPKFYVENPYQYGLELQTIAAANNFDSII
jgi:hypothetical protein